MINAGDRILGLKQPLGLKRQQCRSECGSSHFKGQDCSSKLELYKKNLEYFSCELKCSDLKRQRSPLKRQWSSLKQQRSPLKQQTFGLKQQRSPLKQQRSGLKRQWSWIKRERSHFKCDRRSLF
jgi:chromosome segregation ATPase